MVSAKLPFMTRLPKKRGITQDGEDKSLILRSKMGSSLETSQGAPTGGPETDLCV